MNPIEALKQKFAPKIICPGVTPEQIKEFLKRNFIVGGRITLDNPTQLENITNQVMLCGELDIRKSGDTVKNNVSIGGGKIEVL